MDRLPERDELWMAYLDGEMSAAEAAAFDATLSDAERGRAESEVRLEAALACRIVGECRCPDALWNDLVTSLGAKRRPAWWHVERPWRLAAAAVLALGVWGSIFTMNYSNIFPPAPDSPLVMKAQKPEDLLPEVTVKGGTNEVQKFLDDQKLGVVMHAFNDIQATSDHTLALLGAGVETYGGMSVPVVYFDCCHEPAKVVLLHNCRSGTSCWKDPAYDVCNTKPIGQFVAVAVSKHRHASRLLRLFDEQPIRIGMHRSREADMLLAADGIQ